MNYKPTTVDELRKKRFADSERAQHNFNVLSAGYQTEFWQLLKEEMKARHDALLKAIVNADLKTDADMNTLILMQAEIRILSVLLAQEETLQKPLPAPRSPI